MPRTIEELEAEIEKLKARAARAASDVEDDDTGRAIPYARFQAHRKDLRELLDGLDAIKREVGEVRTSSKTEIDRAAKKARDEAEATVTGLRSQHGDEIALAELGIKDAMGRRLIREHVLALPEADRKDGAAGWLRARRAAAEAHYADKTKPAPEPIPWLAGYEQTAEEPPPRQAARPAGNGTPPPAIGGGGRRQGAQGYGIDDLTDDVLSQALGIDSSKGA